MQNISFLFNLFYFDPSGKFIIPNPLHKPLLNEPSAQISKEQRIFSIFQQNNEWEDFTIASAIGQQQMSHAMLLSLLIPVANVTRSVLIAISARLNDPRSLH